MTPGPTSYQRPGGAGSPPAVVAALLCLLAIPGLPSASGAAVLTAEPDGALVGPAVGGAADDEGDGDDSGPPHVVEVVTVTATRLPLRLADVPAEVRTWSGEAIRRAPALTLDGVLERAPEFSLYRRTSSLTAHPTSQGINLRGVAPSGVSRALVLVDGVPLNDPFGGWIYWDRVPGPAIERVEMALGGGSAPYGNHALSGVVQIVTRPPSSTLRLDALGGERTTGRVGLAAGGGDDAGGWLASAQLFHTDGYVTVEPAARGAVDGPVASRHAALRLRLDRDGWRATVDALHERRDNGTPERTNRTTSWGGSLAWVPAPAPGDHGPERLEIHGFARRQSFHSTFSAVSADRRSELPVLAQEVPSTDLGAAVRSWRPVGDASILSVGGDWRRVAGTSRERVLVTGDRRSPGGTQHLAGAWATLDWGAGDTTRIALSVRADGWHNGPDRRADPATSHLTVSPRAGLVWHAGGGLTLRGSAYRSFRAPTLNELYRGFRVGDVVTRANPRLDAEHLTGLEGGVGWSGIVAGDDRLVLGATAWWNRVDDAIVNATLDSADPTLRQRLNAGTATITGVEVDGRVELGDRWSLGGAAALLDARLDRPGGGGAADADPRLPQVPGYRATATARLTLPGRLQATLAARAVGRQFEDDRNRLSLAPATTVDAAVELPVRAGLQLTLRGENLLERRTEVGRTPVLLLGPPRILYAGVTMTLPLGEKLGAAGAPTRAGRDARPIRRESP